MAKDNKLAGPTLVCANCGKSPSDHNVTAASERLSCRDRSERHWKYTDDRRAWDILRQLDAVDGRQEHLKRELAVLTAQPWAGLASA